MVGVVWGDPDATMWGANNVLAQYSDRPFTLSARASHRPAQETTGQHSPDGLELVENPTGVLHCCPQSHV